MENMERYAFNLIVEEVHCKYILFSIHEKIFYPLSYPGLCIFHLAKYRVQGLIK